MRTRYFILIILLFYSLNGFPQPKVKGYVVTNNNDTLFGWMRYKEHTQVIILQAAKFNYKPVLFGPTQIKSFFLHDAEYIRFPVERDKVTGVPIPRSLDSAFFHQLLKGPIVSLYQFYDHELGKTRFFYQISEQCLKFEKGNKISYLEFEWPYSRDHLERLGRLIGFTGKHMKIIRDMQVDRVEDVIMLFEYLNGRVPERIANSIEPGNLSWFITASSGFTQLLIPAGGGAHTKNNGTYQSFGAGVDLWSGDYFSRGSIRLECNYHNYNFLPVSYKGLTGSISLWHPIAWERISLASGVSINAHYNHVSRQQAENIKQMFQEVRKSAISVSAKVRVTLYRRWEIGAGALVVNTMTVDPFLVNPGNYFLFTAYHLKKIKRFNPTFP